MPASRVIAAACIGCSLAWSGPSIAQEHTERDETPPASAVASQSQEPTLAEALSGGDAAVVLRYRYEFVDQAGFDLNAKASTLRTTLAYGTRPFHGFRLYLQAENVADLGLSGDHNNAGVGDSGNGATDFPVIADPPGTEMLQAYVGYTGGGSTVLVGRQNINLDDQRHVGSVGWRQHWQSHDAIRFRNESIDNFTVHYAFLDKQRTITRAKRDTASHLINAQYRFEGVGSLTGYAYLLRYDERPLAPLSRDTFGAEFKGSHPAGDIRLLYEVEWAKQSAAGGNPGRLSADYLHLMAGVGHAGFTLRAGWERIGGSVRDGQFQFLLGTNHAFNGWTDKFLSTPRDGLSDVYARLNGPLGPIRWQLRYHDFGAVTGTASYGSEFDFQATYQTTWDQLIAVKGGIYNADEFATDTTKIWLWTQYSF
jgi:hypothetical protein